MSTDPKLVMTPSPYHAEEPFNTLHDTQGLSSSDTLAMAPQRPGQDDCKSTDSGSDTAYLQSKAWWTGMTLMILGECGNFMAYGYAAASIIAPLGTVALISNVILAPLMLREPFRRRDLLGIVIAIIGTVVVVINSKENEIKLTPETMAAALLQTQFLVYFIISCVALGVLISLSDTIGSEYIFIDLSVVAIFGGYTVLATKGVSSLLSLSFYKMFTYPISYLLVFVLVSTAVLQIKFLNKSLQRFDSTQVIPTQFVLFTTSAIIGSGILYNDFDEMDFNKGLHFLTGCCMTFLGVYFITSHREKDVIDSPVINPDWTMASHQHYAPIPQRSSFDLYPPNRVLYQPEHSRSDLFLEQGRAQPRDMSYGVSSHPNRPPRSTATGDSFGQNASVPLLGTSAKQSMPMHREAGFSLTSSMHNVLAAVGSRHTSLLGLEKVMENYTAHKNEERRGSIHSLNQTAPLLPPRPGLGSRSSSACSGIFPPPSITTYPSSTSLLHPELNYGSSYQTHIQQQQQPQPSPLQFSRLTQPGGSGSIDPRFHAPHLQERSQSQDGIYKQPRRKISTPMLRENNNNREVPPLPPKIKTSAGVAVPGPPHGRRGDRHALPSPSEHEFMTSVARSIDSVSSSTPRASSKFPMAGGILTASPTKRPKKKTGGSGSGSTVAQDGDSSTVSPTQARRKGSVPKGDDSSRQQQ
ncbi:hypothetical protein BG015_010111 [Linnemannia schmuckeri]|uniref:DUF803-domain-containing protein n=1 Tax=Linnemannia schmuckeri TaxID=64567 RepID=A0A9P5VFK0_9FUNG|nr:hypothetical protein BG015_010111 [Linnemannia schmuckeri]